MTGLENIFEGACANCR